MKRTILSQEIVCGCNIKNIASCMVTIINIAVQLVSAI